MDEIYSSDEMAAGVVVERHLKFHKVGCVKRYGAIGYDDAGNEVMCECERMRLASNKSQDGNEVQK